MQRADYNNQYNSPQRVVKSQSFPFLSEGDHVLKHARHFSGTGVLILCALLVNPGPSNAREENEPGHSIGKVSINGDLIVVELGDGALGKANLFDLSGRTLRFAPEGSRFSRGEWAIAVDSDFGPELASAEVTLHQFAFPFSGHQWRSFLVGSTGSIRFGAQEKDIRPDDYGRMDGGVSLGRFDQLAQAAGRVIDSAPAICIFLKPRMSPTARISATVFSPRSTLRPTTLVSDVRTGIILNAEPIAVSRKASANR